MRYARLSVLLICLLASAALAEAAGHVVMRDGLLYKPHAFSVSGDGDFLVRGLHWRTWGGKTAVATGQAVEQVRPSHTLSRRTYCAKLHRTVYNDIAARIVGPNPGVFGGRTLGRVYTCAGTWRLTG
jgi:hypothetical protein